MVFTMRVDSTIFRDFYVQAGSRCSFNEHLLPAISVGSTHTP
jgi:hypothetical protein